MAGPFQLYQLEWHMPYASSVAVVTSEIKKKAIVLNLCQNSIAGRGIADGLILL